MDYFSKGKKDSYTDVQIMPDSEVNEIIMKIELKKFKKLIENRISRKNALLKADVKRLYPMCYHPADSKLEDKFMDLVSGMSPRKEPDQI